MKSWRTTILGVSLVFTGILNAVQAICDGDPSTVIDWNVVAAQFSAGVGLILARDNRVRSEDVGL